MNRALLALLVAVAAVAVLILWRGGGTPIEQEAEGTSAPPTTANREVDPVDGDRTAEVETAPRREVETPPATSESRSAQRAFELRGRIDPHPAAPLSSARVKIYAGRPSDRRMSFSRIMDVTVPGHAPSTRDLTLQVEGEPIATAEIAEDGSFRVESLTLRDLRVVIDDDFYALEQTLPVHAPDGTALVDVGTIASHCGALVTGRVLGLGPDDHAAVDLSLDANPMEVMSDPQLFMSRMAQGGGIHEAVAADGTFRMPAVAPAASARLSLQSESVVAQEQSLALGAGEIHEIVILALRGGTIRVTVTDPQGAPVATASVRASPSDADGDYAMARMGRHGRTDEAGLATLRGLRVGDWSVVVRRPGYLTQNTRSRIEGEVELQVSVTLDPGATVAGRVVDAEGTGIEHARVARVEDFEIPVVGRLSDMIGQEVWALQASESPIETDADGHFVLSGLEHDKPTSIAAWHVEFIGGLTTDVAPGTQDVEIRLRTPARLHGRVVDAAHKQPVLEFEARTVETMALVMERPSGIAKLDPDAPGEFTIPHLPPGKTTLRVEAEGYATFEQSVEGVTDSVTDLGDLELVPAAGVRGQVLDGQNRGVAGATVTRYRRGLQGNPLMQMFLDVERVVSQPDGSFELLGLAPGALELKASHRDFASGRSTRIELVAGQILEGVEIALPAGGAIAGHLVLSPGQRGSDWQIIATLEMQAATYATTSDTEGHFHFDHLDPGRYDVQAMDLPAMEELQRGSRGELLSGRSPDVMKLVREAQEITVNVRTHVRENETTELEIDVSDLDWGQDELTLAIDVGGRPLERGMVEATATGASGGEDVQFGFVTNGEVTFRRLHPGLVRFQARSGFTMSPIGDPLSFELKDTDGPQKRNWSLPGGSIAGRVVDAERGDEIHGAVVRLVSADAGREGRGRDIGFTLSDRDGHFEFKGLSAGRFTLLADDMLVARNGGEVSARIDDVQVGAGSEIKDLVLRAHRGAGIRIEVVDAANQPVAHARVLAVAPDGEPLGSLPFAMTDSDGVAELAGLPGGATRVVAWAPGLAPGASAVQTLDAEGRGDFRVTLSSGPETELRILDGEGRPLPHAAVSLRFGAGPWLPAILLGRSVDGEGRIALGPMPRTSIEFSVTHPRASFVARRDVAGSSRAALVIQP